MSDVNDTTPLKRCTKCGEEKPATTEYFLPRANRPCGLRSHCKSCEYNASKAYRAANADRMRGRQTKYRADNMERIRERDRQSHAKTRQHDSENARKWRDANREYVRSRDRKYYTENRERITAVRQKRRILKRDHLQNTARLWQQRNPDRVRELARKYRSRKSAVACNFTSAHERIALEYFNGCCAVCGRQLKDLFDTHTFAMDHWIPLSKGGATTIDNMVPLCHQENGCNNSKHDKDAEQWLISRFGTRKAKAIISRVNAFFEYMKARG